VTGSARHCCPRSWRSPSSPAFNGFPALGSILAQDRYLPRQLNTRGDRLAFGNGIVLLAGFASLLVVAFQAEVTRPIQLYYAVMRTIRRHYDNVARELAADASDDATVLPSRNHAVVLVSKIHPPTLRVLSYARATRASTLVAVTVRVDEAEAAALEADWERRELPVPLVMLDSPYREITRPALR
jgi:hypothetical protein